jgi:DNA polymerase-3 subunit beta
VEITIDRDDLLRTVSKAQSIIERRSNMPILASVLLTTRGSAVQMSATDLELAFQQEVQAEVLEEGSLAISGRKLFEIAKEGKKSRIQIKERENNWVFISDGVARYNLACLPSDEFPVFASPEGVKMVEVDGEILSEMISKTIYAVTLEEAGFKLSGVFTERIAQEGKTLLRMVATDGHRLSMVDKSVPDLDALELPSGVMVPKKGMSELNKLASDGGAVSLGFKKNNCVARNKGAFLVIRLLETKFPDYHAVIPKQAKHHIEVSRLAVLEAMKRMLILSSEHYRAVKIGLQKGSMELVSTNPDVGEAQETIPVEYGGEHLEMGFNARYFIDTLQSIESETIILGFIDNSKPCLIRGEADKGFLGLIMPMRL